MHTAAIDSSVDRGIWPRLRASSRRLGVARSVFSWPLSAMRHSLEVAQEFEAFRHQPREALLQRRDAGEDDEQADDERDREADREEIERRRGARHHAECQ